MASGTVSLGSCSVLVWSGPQMTSLSPTIDQWLSGVYHFINLRASRYMIIHSILAALASFD